MPARDDVPVRRKSLRAAGAYRLAASEDVRRAAIRAVRSPPRRYRSLTEFRNALLPILRREDPKCTLGGRRLRSLVVEIPSIRMEVRYSEQNRSEPLTHCPVCGAPVRPLRNRTLTGEEVVLGYRCSRCAYWTHRKRRIPVRYTFQRKGSVRDTPS